MSPTAVSVAAAEWPPITFVVVVVVVSAPRLPIEDMFLSGAVEGERAAVERERERERPALLELNRPSR